MTNAVHRACLEGSAANSSDNQTHTISLFGVQGGGKSYTLGAIAEMASLKIPGINLLPRPLATVIFHYSPTMDYRPEFTSMVSPNSIEQQVRQLRDNYGAEPQGLSDVVLLAPADKINERKAEYPDIEVLPLKFAAAELQSSHWRFLMGAVGNQATYIRQLNRLMKALRGNMTIDALRQGIDNSSLPDHLQDLARMRLDLASEYIDDTAHLSEVMPPWHHCQLNAWQTWVRAKHSCGRARRQTKCFQRAESRFGVVPG